LREEYGLQACARCREPSLISTVRDVMSLFCSRCHKPRQLMAKICHSSPYSLSPPTADTEAEAEAAPREYESSSPFVRSNQWPVRPSTDSGPHLCRGANTPGHRWPSLFPRPLRRAWETCPPIRSSQCLWGVNF